MASRRSRWAVGVDTPDAETFGAERSLFPLQGQARLTARHREVDVREYLRVQQRSMELALRVVDAVAPAQRVQAAALPRMELAGECQRVPDGTVVQQLPPTRSHAFQLGVQEAHIEGRVMDDHLASFDEGQEVVCDVRKPRLVCEKFRGDPVHLHRGRVDLPVRLKVLVIAVSSEPAIDQLHAADLDDPVPLGRVEPGRFGVQHDLAHTGSSVLDDQR
jgi:hypothetical protein